MRCLGLSNQPMALNNNNGRHGAISPHPNDSLSPQSASSSPTSAAAQQPQQQSSLNKPLTSVPINTITSHQSLEKQAIHPTSGKSGGDESSENGFTLMHPAFQGPQRTKSYKKMDVPKHMMSNDGHISNRTLIPYPMDYPSKLPLASATYPLHTSDSRHQHQETSNQYLNKVNSVMDDKRGHIGAGSGMNQCADDSTDSEEIDLTSNGCIDFSNNNNNNNNIQGHSKCL